MEFVAFSPEDVGTDDVGDGVLRRMGVSGGVATEDGLMLPPGVDSRRVARITAEAVVELTAAPALFEWREPERPENLHLLRSDGSAILSSVAIEYSGWLSFRDEGELSRWQAAASEAVMQLFSRDADYPGKVEPLDGFAADVRSDEAYAVYLRARVGMLDPALRPAVVRYLRTAEVVLRGDHTKDLLGETFNRDFGTAFLSDGTYCWWKDTADYVEHYGIGLSEEALAHMASNGWECPVLTDDECFDVGDFIVTRGLGR